MAVLPLLSKVLHISYRSDVMYSVGIEVFECSFELEMSGLYVYEYHALLIINKKF